jgi:hypothetical protein
MRYHKFFSPCLANGSERKVKGLGRGALDTHYSRIFNSLPLLAVTNYGVEIILTEVASALIEKDYCENRRFMNQLTRV